MRLNSDLVQRTLSQFEAQAIPDNHPSMPDLSRTFGDHTFFIDADGLHIVEPAMPSEDGHEAGQVVRWPAGKMPTARAWWRIRPSRPTWWSSLGLAAMGPARSTEPVADLSRSDTA